MRSAWRRPGDRSCGRSSPHHESASEARSRRRSRVTARPTRTLVPTTSSPAWTGCWSTSSSADVHPCPNPATSPRSYDDCLSEPHSSVGANTRAQRTEDHQMLALRPAAQQTASVAAAVTDAHLDAPTPCTEYSVSDLLAHLSGLSVAFRDAARKVGGSATPE